LNGGKIENENDITQARVGMAMHHNTHDERGNKGYFSKEQSQPLMRRDLLPPTGRTREIQRSEIQEQSESSYKRSKSQNFKQSLNDRIFDQYGIQLNSSLNKFGKTSHNFQSTRSLSHSNHQSQSKLGLNNETTSTRKNLHRERIPDTPGSSSQKPPVIIEILKQELLSTKRQIRDQQSSNQFLKKENYRLEHEKNLVQIQHSQQANQIGELQQEIHELK
jgi:hypothetical protein